jgi:hypothetical protein
MKKPSKDIRIQYNVDYAPDSAFSANARLLQSRWRDNKGYPFKKYGNFLDIDFAINTKSNFLTDNIKQLVAVQIADSKSKGKLISEPRIWNNLLSSQPLCFNLFGELHYDLHLATSFFKKIFPDRIDNVLKVDFEHSPGRRDKRFTGDRSAFDVFVEYTKGNKRGFIGIEVKYAESLKEETKDKAKSIFESHKNEYINLTTSDYFKSDSIDSLCKVPVSQIWRDHLLSIATKSIYDEGFFVFLFPADNIQCQNGVDDYKRLLVSDNEVQTGFYPRHLEDFIETLVEILPTDWTNELKSRYLGI